jgi:hypothetical protein
LTKRDWEHSLLTGADVEEPPAIADGAAGVNVMLGVLDRGLLWVLLEMFSCRAAGARLDN